MRAEPDGEPDDFRPATSQAGAQTTVTAARTLTVSVVAPWLENADTSLSPVALVLNHLGPNCVRMLPTWRGYLPAGRRGDQRGVKRFGDQRACLLFGVGSDNSHITVSAGPPVGIIQVSWGKAIEKHRCYTPAVVQLAHLNVSHLARLLVLDLGKASTDLGGLMGRHPSMLIEHGRVACHVHLLR
jgi:hypothetical protein